MNHEPTDQPLRRKFRRLREQDEGSTPSFSSILGRTRQRHTTTLRGALVLRLAGVAACIALGFYGLVLYLHHSSDEQFARTLRVAEPLSRWKAPSDILLEAPSPDLLGNVPKLGETFADMNINLE